MPPSTPTRPLPEQRYLKYPEEPCWPQGLYTFCSLRSVSDPFSPSIITPSPPGVWLRYVPSEKAQLNILTVRAHVCMFLAHLSCMPYAQPLGQCLAQSRDGVHVCCMSGAMHASLPVITCQVSATLSFLQNCACSPKSRAQAPHLFQFLHCVQENCGGDVRWHPRE